MQSSKSAFIDRLFANLRDDTYCRLRPSRIHGVGVFAIKEIPRGTNPFKTVLEISDEAVYVARHAITALDPGVQQTIRDFFIETEDNYYPIQINGVNGMDISCYMNHSVEPNIRMHTDNDGKNSLYQFFSTRVVRVGEELTFNYFEHSNPNEREMIARQFQIPL